MACVMITRPVPRPDHLEKDTSALKKEEALDRKRRDRTGQDGTGRDETGYDETTNLVSVRSITT